jgi:hypothetical protein
MNMAWDMLGQLWLVPDPANAAQNISSYVPTFNPDNNLAVTVNHWIMEGEDETPVVLTSSMTFNSPMVTPTLDLWDPNPVLTLAFSQNHPEETVEIKGQSEQMSIYGSMLMTVVASNQITLPQVEAITGNTPGGDPSSTVDTSALAQAAQQLQSQQGNPAWLMSAAGQAALGAVEQQAIATVSIPASEAATPTQMASTFQSIILPWKTGSALPAKQILQFNSEGEELTITLAIWVYQVLE